MVTESSLIGLYPRSRSGSSCGFILRCLAIRSRRGFGGLGKFLGGGYVAVGITVKTFF